MIKVIIADDHAVVRQGIKGILAEDPCIQVVGEARNGVELLDMVVGKKCDVLIMDMSMPGKNGIEVLEELHKFKLQLPVLVLSMHPEEQYALRVLKAGASGYLTKESVPEVLLKAVKKIASGEKYLTSTLSEKLIYELKAPGKKAAHEMLSTREFLVMRMIASGKTVSSIADELYLSVKTVSTYRSRIMSKMNMKTTAEIIRYVIENRLLD